LPIACPVEHPTAQSTAHQRAPDNPLHILRGRQRAGLAAAALDLRPLPGCLAAAARAGPHVHLIHRQSGQVCGGVGAAAAPPPARAAPLLLLLLLLRGRGGPAAAGAGLLVREQAAVSGGRGRGGVRGARLQRGGRCKKHDTAREFGGGRKPCARLAGGGVWPQGPYGLSVVKWVAGAAGAAGVAAVAAGAVLAAACQRDVLSAARAAAAAAAGHGAAGRMGQHTHGSRSQRQWHHCMPVNGHPRGHEPHGRPKHCFGYALDYS
jgi:hypothetical protein